MCGGKGEENIVSGEGMGVILSGVGDREGGGEQNVVCWPERGKGYVCVLGVGE